MNRRRSGGLHGSKRKVGAPGLEDRQQGNHQVHASGKAHRADAVGAESNLPKVPRQAIGGFVQFAVGQCPIALDDRRCVRLAGGDIFDPLVDTTFAWERTFRAVPVNDQLLAFGVGQKRQLTDGTGRVGHNPLEQNPKVSGQPGNGIRVEQLRAVIDLAAQPVGALPQIQRDIKQRGALPHLE
jgi:hypothetical protein